MLKEVEFTLDSCNETALPLGQEILIVGSMSVISARGFENRLTDILESSHRCSILHKTNFKSDVGFEENLSFEAV